MSPSRLRLFWLWSAASRWSRTSLRCPRPFSEVSLRLHSYTWSVLVLLFLNLELKMLVYLSHQILSSVQFVFLLFLLHALAKLMFCFPVPLFQMPVRYTRLPESAGMGIASTNIPKRASWACPHNYWVIWWLLSCEDQPKFSFLLTAA